MEYYPLLDQTVFAACANREWQLSADMIREFREVLKLRGEGVIGWLLTCH